MGLRKGSKREVRIDCEVDVEEEDGRGGRTETHHSFW